jgi:release factor glutamine methyltransferase
MEEHVEKPSRWTIKDILEWTTDYFRKRGIKTARLDAEVLLAHALGANRLHLYLNLDRPLRSEERAQYRELVRRRASREPVALIVGTREFWSIPFRVIPGVLIPRPDTEVLVEAVVNEVRDAGAPWILEIGTGCGAVAVAVLQELPAARVLATDMDRRALELTFVNAQTARIRGSLELVASDLFSAIRPGTQFDVICSNPPYIPSDAIAGLEPEIRLFEPLRALNGGPDGLEFIRLLARDARHFLKRGGALILELGEGQAEDCSEILIRIGGFGDIRTFRDLAGKIRVVRGRL